MKTGNEEDIVMGGLELGDVVVGAVLESGNDGGGWI